MNVSPSRPLGSAFGIKLLEIYNHAKSSLFRGEAGIYDKLFSVFLRPQTHAVRPIPHAQQKRIKAIENWSKHVNEIEVYDNH